MRSEESVAAHAPPTAAGSLPTKTSCMALFPGVAGRGNRHQPGGLSSRRTDPSARCGATNVSSLRSPLTAHRSRLTAGRAVPTLTGPGSPDLPLFGWNGNPPRQVDSGTISIDGS